MVAGATDGTTIRTSFATNPAAPRRPQRTAFVPDTAVQRPPPRELQRFVGDELTQICVWGSSCTITDMWKRLDMTCDGPARQAGMEKVDRIPQFNGAVQFDIYIRKAAATRVKQRMEVHNRRWNWHLREHIPFQEHGLAPRTQQLAAPDTAAMLRAPLRPGTLNINGVQVQYAKNSITSDLLD